jgi:membrane protease YdiL (CAAX protease family)
MEQLALLLQPPAGRSWLLGRTVLRILLALACTVPLLMLLVPAVGRMVTDPAWLLPETVMKVGLILGVYAAYVTWVEKRAPGELSWRGAGREWCAGLALGMLLFAVAVGVLAAAGAYRITGSSGWSVLAAAVPGMLVAALYEELIFRAIVFRLLEESFGSWLALAVSALVFGLLHLGSPGAGLVGAIAIAIEAGLLLGAAYMLTRRLWLCTAIHLGWNATQGAIFSAAVSGRAQQGVFRAEFSGPDWLTGGQFGPEASVVSVLVCTCCAVLVLRRCVAAGRVVPPCWRRPA